MSVLATAIVWQNSPNDKSTLLVELALADFADDAGRCWPSLKTLARKARLGIGSDPKTANGERHATRIVKALSESGALTVSRGSGPNGVNTYQLALSAYISGTVRPAVLIAGAEATSADANEQAPVTQTSTGHATNTFDQVTSCHGDKSPARKVTPDAEVIPSINSESSFVVVEKNSTLEFPTTNNNDFDDSESRAIAEYLRKTWSISNERVITELLEGAREAGWTRNVIEWLYGKRVAEEAKAGWMKNPTGIFIQRLRDAITRNREIAGSRTRPA